MATSPLEDRIKLIVTIVDRGRGTKAANLYRLNRLHFDFICLGFGTANSKILNYFGLAETEKDIVLTLAPSRRIRHLLGEVEHAFQLRSPGKGIVFTVPLSGISSQSSSVINKTKSRGEEPEMNENPSVNPQDETPYELILTILNRGYVELVMDAAREAGARGGTVINGRRVGFEDAQNLLGFTIQPEKEIIAILVPRSIKVSVMQAINKVAGLTTECRGIVTALPVDDILGINTQQI